MNGHDLIDIEPTEQEYYAMRDAADAAEMDYYRQMEEFVDEYAERPDCPYCENPVGTRRGEPYCEDCEVRWAGGWPQLADERRANIMHDIEADRRHEMGVAR